MTDRNCDVAMVSILTTLWAAQISSIRPGLQSTGLALDARGEVGRITVHRFSALLEDGVVKLIMTEPGGLGLTCSVVRT